MEAINQDGSRYLRKALVIGRIAFLSLITCLAVVIVIHNLIAPTERDIPTERIDQLIQLLPLSDGLHHPNVQWLNRTSPNV